LRYRNDRRAHKIFLRQGEGADFLMHPADPSKHRRNMLIPLGANSTSSGSARAPYNGNVYDPNAVNRPVARRFLPYNLTAPADVQMPGALGVNGGELTKFPTQTGAYFKFIDQNRPRWAYPPQGQVVTTTLNATPDGFWTGAPNHFSTINETCPQGYRRPTDGPTNANARGDIANSEIRQSLFMNPRTGTSTNRDNSAWGFYADGFFDRRPISGKTHVAGNTNDVAWIGRIFFNDIWGSTHYNASVFFPAAGYRERGGSNPPHNQRLSHEGREGHYMTASRYSNSARQWNLRFTKSNHRARYADNVNELFCIRCVRGE